MGLLVKPMKEVAVTLRPIPFVVHWKHLGLISKDDCKARNQYISFGSSQVFALRYAHFRRYSHFTEHHFFRWAKVLERIWIKCIHLFHCRSFAYNLLHQVCDPLTLQDFWIWTFIKLFPRFHHAQPLSVVVWFKGFLPSLMLNRVATVLNFPPFPDELQYCGRSGSLFLVIILLHAEGSPDDFHCINWPLCSYVWRGL